ncbi:GHKL domain-containing protein [Duganella sp. FT109W]|uniref:GHKL domain-containing protein n=1 Tax=Duganella margarita TaxID=2692170 RepID=A0ABW9WPP7_9BURK|nr:sensor histidine kinase [Duganella margarita]MYN42861.1 GHKL domain-containing protein [Duganella margarita]
MAKLKPRARIIRTIGDQLISGPEAALIELVKNSYDADSTWIKIKIAPKCDSYPDGLVHVFDNGHGMTESEIECKWFEPATDEKKNNRFSRSGKRIMLGAKGIGRFASARLGSLTTISSIAYVKDNYEKTELTVDWRDFESSKYLEDLDIPLHSQYLKGKNSTGFSVKINDSRVAWTEKSLEKIIGELRRLISPTDVRGDFNIYLDLSEFKKTNTEDSSSGIDGDDILRKSIAETNSEIIYVDETYALIKPYQIQDKADYVLTGKYDSLGGFEGQFQIERGDNVSQKISIPPSPMGSDEEKCGPFSIRIQIYDREPEAVEALFQRMGLDVKKIGVRRARQILNENAGIAVYRDGFRIRPYGEAENDWLMLESRRIQEPSKRIGHTQTSGQIFIADEALSNLIERSSREGFEHNGAFERLRGLITATLVRAEEKRFDYRQNAGLSRKPVGDVAHIKELANLSSLVTAAQALPLENRKIFLEKIKKESDALTKSLDEIDAYKKLLESTSALGMVVARVIHDGRRYLEPMSYAAVSLVEGKDALFDQTTKGEVIRKYYPIHAETINTGVKGLSSLFKALDPVSGRRRGKPGKFLIQEVVETAVDFLRDSLIENGIEVTYSGDNPVFGYGYKGDLQSSLLNILDNAIHWLSTVTKNDKKIGILFSVSKNESLISISNNGPLIDLENSQKLFDAGFTLKSEGHGLGLLIAREACRASKGDIYYEDHAIETTFVIKFPNGM